MKPIDLCDIEHIATYTASYFRDKVEKTARHQGRRKLDVREIARISVEVERVIIAKLEQYVREYESIRDRESLVPGGRK